MGTYWLPVIPRQHLSFTNAIKIAPAKTNVPEIRFLTGTVPSSFRTATIGPQEQFSQCQVSLLQQQLS